jgi:hypothetical protein
MRINIEIKDKILDMCIKIWIKIIGLYTNYIKEPYSNSGYKTSAFLSVGLELVNYLVYILVILKNSYSNNTYELI